MDKKYESIETITGDNASTLKTAVFFTIRYKPTRCIKYARKYKFIGYFNTHLSTFINFKLPF